MSDAWPGALKPFSMKGRINAPGYGQPGGGLQFRVEGSLLGRGNIRTDVPWLVGHHFIKPLP